MLVIGLTGGIGSGKSAAAEVFAELGVPVIDSDIIAREVVARNSPTLQSIVAHFGPQYLTQEGSLNRVKMRQDIFSDHSKRKALEQIIHPPIRLATQQRLQQARGPYVVLMMPLLLETHQEDLVNRILVIDVSEQTQLSRVQQRDGCGAAQVQGILAAQLPRAQRLAAADDVINNDADTEALKQAVRSLHATYLNMAKDRH